MVSNDEHGQCPSCDLAGPTGQPCPERICAKRGMHFVPTAYLAGTVDASVGMRIGDWLVVKLLGAGGFGRVFLVLQVPILLKAALKLLHPQESGDMARRILERFEGEARALATLSHPNVVRLFQYGVHEQQPFLVMEFVEGARTFKDEIAERASRGEEFTAVELRHILGQMVDGLEAAHARGIVHRDIKPENVMLQRVEGNDAFVRIVDFGLAKDVSEGNETSVAMGTPVYMAPEQVDRRNIGPWTDWYAMGVVTFELLTGRRPFAGRTQREILARKLDPRYDVTESVADLDLPDPVVVFLRRALARDPEARYRNAQQFRAAFLKAMDAVHGAEKPAVGRVKAALAALGEPVAPTEAVAGPTVGVPLMPQPAPNARRSPVPWIVAGVAAMAAVSVIVVAIAGGDAPIPVAPTDAAETVRVNVETSAQATPPSSTPDAAIIAVETIPDVSPAAPALPHLPEGMVLIPAGAWPVGCQVGDTGCWDDEKPSFTADRRPFAIQKTEVTINDWYDCVRANVCRPFDDATPCRDGAVDGAPVRCIDWHDANAYCAWRGWRLPTEIEWEIAARGAAHPDHPWGDAGPTCAMTVMARGPRASERGCGTGRTALVGATPGDRSWAGVMDLGGNVREWTSSEYLAYPGGTVEPTPGRVVRGGSWFMEAGNFATSHTRGVEAPAARLPDLGLRCALDPSP